MSGPMTKTFDDQLISRVTGPFPDLADWQRRRIVHQVAALAERIFSRPLPPRPTSLARELRSAYKKLQAAAAALDDLSDLAWVYVLKEERWDECDDRASLERLLRAFKKGDKLAEDYVRMVGNSKGGRQRDKRLDRFTTVLAAIYKDWTGKGPTHTTDKITGAPVSDFNRFAQECYRAFYPGEIPWGAVRESMRQITILDWSDKED